MRRASINIEDSFGFSDGMSSNASQPELTDPDATAGIPQSKICKVAKHANKITPIAKKFHAKAVTVRAALATAPHPSGISTSARLCAKV